MTERVDTFITTMRLPILQPLCRLFFGKASHHPGLWAPLQPRFVSLRLLAFPKAKIAAEREEICDCDCHTVHKHSQRHLSADWLAPRESDCSRMHTKVSSDWLPSYIKATWPVLEVFKMAGNFPKSPHIILPKNYYHCGNFYSYLYRFLLLPTSDIRRNKGGASYKFKLCHPEVFNTYINIQWCISQTQNIVLGQHVSILIESSSGPSKKQILT